MKKKQNTIKDNHYRSNIVMDRKGNLISTKKRVNDTKIVDSLLSSKSKLKLTLKQYTFLQQVKLQDKVTEAQRDWLISLSNKQKNIL